MRTSRGFRFTVILILAISALAFLELERRAANTPQNHVELIPLSIIPLTPPVTIQANPTHPARATKIAPRLTSPCDAQINLRIGTVDSEFKLERPALEKALLDAANEWNSATGRAWFKVSSSGGVAVNLLFDGRQAELEERQTAEAQLDAEMALLKSELAQESQDIERLTTSFNQKRTHYEELVSTHNAAVSQAQQTGSASQETVAALRAEEGQLGELRRELDASLERIKPLIDAFKQRSTARTEALNEKIAAFKERYPPIVIREAEHRSGAFVNEVNVYTFTDARNLHYTLLHELGHTLGLSHAPEGTAVMAPIREAESEVYHVTKTDIDAALQLCADSE